VFQAEPLYSQVSARIRNRTLTSVTQPVSEEFYTAVGKKPNFASIYAYDAVHAFAHAWHNAIEVFQSTLITLLVAKLDLDIGARSVLRVLCENALLFVKKKIIVVHRCAHACSSIFQSFFQNGINITTDPTAALPYLKQVNFTGASGMKTYL
jgi:hypothetical protein